MLTRPIVALLAVLVPFIATAGTIPRRPFPQHVQYAPGTIRPNHRTQAQQDQDVRDYYEAWKSSFLLEAGTAADGSTLYRISLGSTNPGRTVSEGQGYGMMLMAWMAGFDPRAQIFFDGLWKFSRKYPSSVDSRLMGWQIPLDPQANVSAFDGDADIAYALLLADLQWASDGPINDLAEARQVVAGILASTIGPESRLPMFGDWVNVNHATHNQWTTRTSDFMPTHFRAFGQTTGDAVWGRVIAETQSVTNRIQTQYSPVTGLLPDFVVPISGSDHTPRPAYPNFLEATTDGDYNYNAGRVPWRLGADALLNGDPVSLAQTRKISRWIHGAAGGDPSRIRSGYALDGTPLPNSDYFSIFFVSPFGVAAMTDPSQQQWLNDLYDAVYKTHKDYYEDSVNLLCMIVMTGNSWPEKQFTQRRRAVRR